MAALLVTGGCAQAVRPGVGSDAGDAALLRCPVPDAGGRRRMLWDIPCGGDAGRAGICDWWASTKTDAGHPFGWCKDSLINACVSANRQEMVNGRVQYFCGHSPACPAWQVCVGTGPDDPDPTCRCYLRE